MASDDTSPNEAYQSSNHTSSRGTKRKADFLPLEQTSQSSHPASSSSQKSANITTSPRTLDEVRDELLRKYGSVAEKSVSKFLDDHVPRVADTVVDQAMAKLKEKREPPTVKRVDRSGRGTKGVKKTHNSLTESEKVWGYPTQSLSEQKNKQEAETFGPLCSFIKAIVELAAQLNGLKWVDHSSRQEHISGEQPHSSRPDSFLHLIPRLLDDLGWELLLCVGEFKKNDTDKTRLDDWAKVLWGMHHIMRNDPCRLFTFGYSIEDDQARLWYHARSSVFVSEPFNWIKNPKPFVTLILALTLVKSEHFSVAQRDREAGWSAPSASLTQDEVMSVADEPPTFPDEYEEAPLGKDGMDQLYANHSEYLERIGIDSKMKRVLDEAENIQHEITVDQVVFATDSEILCDLKADNATGRCTRVWAVYMKDGDKDKKHVLKDVWLEKGAMVEGEKLEKREARIERDESDHGEVRVKEWHKNHFLHMYKHEILDHLNVLDVSGPHQSIRVLTETSEIIRSSTVHSGSQRVEFRGSPSQVSPLHESHVFDDPSRFHYRIVFKGRMIPLVSAPCPAFSACWVLWTYKRVHRDVSSWNAYWDPKSRTGRIGDFDYMVDYGQPGTGMIKIGTPHFWSVEVEFGEYLYLPAPEHTQTSDLDLSDLSEGVQDAEPDITSIFQHSGLHDLESVYWVSLWTCLYLIGNEDRVAAVGDAVTGRSKVDAGRHTLYKELFPDGTSKEVHLIRGGFIGAYPHKLRQRLWRTYSSSVRNKEIRGLILFHFNQLCETVSHHFKSVEMPLSSQRSIPHDYPAFDQAFKQLHGLLEDLKSRMGNFNQFPMSPLSEYKYVLTNQRGPNDLERWADPADIVPPSQEEEQPVASSSAAFPGSSRSPKRRKTKG
ncbi:hypothetical protein PQX77_014111 [Marasmius sp. AFHP31]|nr:hypothetical protein PQX77_014111 [Marasmius sp. AFHP31]